MKILITEAQFEVLNETRFSYSDIPKEDMDRIKIQAKKEYDELIGSESKDALMDRLIKLNDILDNPENDPEMQKLETVDERNQYYKAIEAEFDKVSNKIIEIDNQPPFDVFLKNKINEYLFQMNFKMNAQRLRSKSEITKEDLIRVISDVIANSDYSRYFNFNYDNFDNELKDKLEKEKKELPEAIGEFIFEEGTIEFLIGKFNRENTVKGKNVPYKWETDETIYIDMDSILDAINLIKKDFPSSFQDILKERSDLDDHELFFQLMLFKEIKYKI